MQQINVYQFYQIANVVHPLTELKAGNQLKIYFYTLIMARYWLYNLVSDKVIPVPICRPVTWKVINAINTLIPADQGELNKLDMEKELTPGDIYGVVEAAKEFETVFSAELQNLATYFVSKKGIYDTNDLIARADDLFTDTIKKQMSDQAKLDICEAGKCLAFDLATASGFHVARAVESVLLDYLKLLCPNIVEKLKDSQRNLGNYIKIAEENKGEPKVCSSLNQFRDLHRNPLIHPEAVLTVEEAITLLGIAQSAIVSMILEMGKNKGGSLPLLPSS
jgi:hypothetical protein